MSTLSHVGCSTLPSRLHGPIFQTNYFGRKTVIVGGDAWRMGKAGDSAGKAGFSWDFLIYRIRWWILHIDM